jgi:hypothetical protein
MADDLKELNERMTHLTDEQLLEMIATPDEYRKEALTYAESELKKRGIDFSQAAELEVKAEDTEDPLDVGICSVCAGLLRSGTLVAEKELTIVFKDNREERFVKVYACVNCGRLSLLVDFETSVEQ